MRKGSDKTRILATAASLTIVSPSWKGKGNPPAAIPYIPVVGLIFGLVLWLSAYVLEGVLYPQVSALVLLVISTLFVRAIPIRGLASTLDRLIGGKGRGAEGMGGMEIVVVTLSLLAKYVLLSQLIEDGAYPLLVLFPTIGRWSIITLIWAFPSFLTRAFGGPPNSRHLIGGTAVTLLCALVIEGLAGLGVMAIVAVASYALALPWVKSNGDINARLIGATIEVAELLTLIFALALQGDG